MGFRVGRNYEFSHIWGVRNFPYYNIRSENARNTWVRLPVSGPFILCLQGSHLPLVSTVLEFYYRRGPSVASLTYRLSVKNHLLEDRLINYIVCTEALASRVVHQVQRALTRGALPSSCSLGQTLTPLFKTRRQAHWELSAQT